MNKKLIAAAVSAVVVAPVASHAEMTVYGRVNNAIDLNDLSNAANADSTTDVSNVSSRFGLKGSTDIGNGMTAHGRYEFATVTDKEQPGIADIRIATAGVSGSFGRIDIGNQWSAYFNTFGTLISPTFSLGYYLYSSVGGGAYRASNTIKYSNTFGPVYAELDVRLNDDSSPEGGDVAEKINGDGVGLGLSFAVNDNITIAAAFDSEDGVKTPEPGEIEFTRDGTAGDGVLGTFVALPPEGELDADRIGIAIKANFGGYWASLGWQNHEIAAAPFTVSGTIDLDDDGNEDAGESSPSVTIDVEVDTDTIFLYGGGNFSEKTNWLIGYTMADDGADVPAGFSGTLDGDPLVSTDDSTQLTWGVYHNLGGGLRMYYEATSIDSDNTGRDGARHLLGMRVDF